MLSSYSSRSQNSNTMKQMKTQTMLAFFCRHFLVNCRLQVITQPISAGRKGKEEVEQFYNLVQIGRGDGSFLPWVGEGVCRQPGGLTSPCGKQTAQ